MSWKFCLMAIVAWIGLACVPAQAQEGPADAQNRLSRLERRINDLAERQDQIFRQLGGAQERQDQMRRRLAAGPERPGPVVEPLPENVRRPQLRDHLRPVAGAPRPCEGLHHLIGLMMLVCLVFNILLAVWIFTDIRKRGEGSGIFIALAIVAGIPAAIIYSLVRIGDKKP